MADVRVKKPDGTWVSIKGPQGDVGPEGPAGPAGADGAQGPAGAGGADGQDGRSIATFDQAGEPGSAIAGDIWFVP